MKNRGFSIIECVLCMLLLSGATMGIISIVLNVHINYKEQLYKCAVYTNLYTIFEVCGLSNDPIVSLNDYYSDNIILKEDDLIVIEINLSSKYLGKDTIKYEISVSKTTSEQIVNVQVINILDKYKGVNDEEISKRYYPL